VAANGANGRECGGELAAEADVKPRMARGGEPCKKRMGHGGGTLKISQSLRASRISAQQVVKFPNKTSEIVERRYGDRGIGRNKAQKARTRRGRNGGKSGC
jgi:hypothetical protein